jgi:hypothetical protein
MRGSLGDFSLADLLTSLARGRETGKLTLTRSDGLGVVLFRRGRIERKFLVTNVEEVPGTNEGVFREVRAALTQMGPREFRQKSLFQGTSHLERKFLVTNVEEVPGTNEGVFREVRAALTHMGPREFRQKSLFQGTSSI